MLEAGHEAHRGLSSVSGRGLKESILHSCPCFVDVCSADITLPEREAGTDLGEDNKGGMGVRWRSPTAWGGGGGTWGNALHSLLDMVTRLCSDVLDMETLS